MLLSDEFAQHDLDTWPNCATPDCEHKACTWSERPDLCFPCGTRALGRSAMMARYRATHDDELPPA